MNGTRLWYTRRRAFSVAAVLAAVVLPLCFGPGSAQASMDLVFAETPDIYSGFIQLHYDSPTPDVLTANGYAMKLKDDTGTTYNIQKYPDNVYVPGSFALEATINSSGLLQPGGTVAFGGYIPDKGYTSGTILTGNLTTLGYGAAHEPLEFLFEVTGGDAAGLFGGISAIAGLILHTQAFPGDFSGEFSNNGSSSNTGSVVPEPATIVLWPLLAMAAAAMQWRRRRRFGRPESVTI